MGGDASGLGSAWRRVLRGALGLALVAVAVAACDDEEKPASTLPQVSAACLTVEEIRAGAVTFRNADGDKLEGFQIGTGPTGVVLAHMSDGDLCQWHEYAKSLSKQGYRVLAFTFGGPIDQDVVAAVQQVRSAGARKVFLIGASMGGTASLAAAAMAAPPVDGVISLSAPVAYRGADALAAMPKLTMPLLLIVGDQDGAYAESARELHTAATAATDKKLMVVFATSLHGTELVSGEVQAAMEAFLRKHAA
jgi:pimeloyl-ACP methyl ester carboxylesterase